MYEITQTSVFVRRHSKLEMARKMFSTYLDPPIRRFGLFNTQADCRARPGTYSIDVIESHTRILL